MSLSRTVLVLLAVIPATGTVFGHGGNNDPNLVHACTNNLTRIVRIVGNGGRCLDAPPLAAETPAHWSLASAELTAGPGIAVSGGGGAFTIVNTGDADPADDVTSLASSGSISIAGSGNARTVDVRVASCSQGSSIRQINGDGTVLCEQNRVGGTAFMTKTDSLPLYEGVLTSVATLTVSPGSYIVTARAELRGLVDSSAFCRIRGGVGDFLTVWADAGSSVAFSLLAPLTTMTPNTDETAEILCEAWRPGMTINNVRLVAVPVGSIEFQ
jgi:hypothetical protein